MLPLLFACFASPPSPASTPAPAASGAWNRDDNGLWMRRMWLHEAGNLPAVEALAATLKARGVRQIYPFLGPLGPEGPGWRDGEQIRPVQPEVATAFLRGIKAADPELVVLPWTGGVLDRDVPLDDPEFRARFAATMAQVVSWGADGVQLNVEPLPSGRAGYLELLTAVKAAIGPDHTLSIAAYPPPTPLHPFPDVHWELPFLAQVCQAADDLAIMAYDTALTDEARYQRLVADWTEALATALPRPESGGCTWRVGVPDYEDQESWHHPEAETLAAAIDGVAEGLQRTRGAPGFRGVAIYASWTTDAAEWARYDRRWRGREPVTAALVDAGGPCLRFAELSPAACDGGPLGMKPRWSAPTGDLDRPLQGCLLGALEDGERRLIVPAFTGDRGAGALLESGRRCLPQGMATTEDDPRVIYTEPGFFLDCADPRCQG